MADYLKELLSGSTNGAPISVTGTTSTTPTVIHTPGTSTTTKDEVHVYAFNPGTAASIVTLQFAGTGAAYQYTATVTQGQPALSLIPGWPVNGGAPVTAFSTSAVKPLIAGYVNRITP